MRRKDYNPSHSATKECPHRTNIPQCLPGKMTNSGKGETKKAVFVCSCHQLFVPLHRFLGNLKHKQPDLMNQYETVFILTPVLSDVQMKEAADKFVNYLKEKGAEIINTENWGLKTLAYPIQKKVSGFYQMIEYKAEPTVIAKLELQMRRDERVLRYLTVKNEKYAAAYAEKRRNKKEA